MGRLVELVLELRQIHGYIPAVGVANGLHDVDQYQFRTMGLTQRFRFVEYLRCFFSQINRNQHLCIGGHGIAPSRMNNFLRIVCSV